MTQTQPTTNESDLITGEVMKEIHRAYADWFNYVNEDLCNAYDGFIAGALRFHKLLDDEYRKIKGISYRRLKKMPTATKKTAARSTKKTATKAKPAAKKSSVKKASKAKTSVTKKRGRPAGSKNKAAQTRKFPKAVQA